MGDSPLFKHGDDPREPVLTGGSETLKFLSAENKKAVCSGVESMF